MSLIKLEKDPVKWNEKVWLLITLQWSRLSDAQKQNVAAALVKQLETKSSNS